jgi:uncharacterized membrane-anchored protein
MKKLQNILVVLFIIMVIAQLAIPASIVIRGESVVAKGKEFKFKVMPIDPSDPFRGKYVSLRFQAEEFLIYDSISFKDYEDIYVIVSTDYKGYAQIADITTQKPDQGDYIKATMRHFYTSNTDGLVTTKVYIKYPFNRYYMEETKAEKAENLYFKMLGDSTKTTYAVVWVKDGVAVLEDVMINGQSLKNLLE